MKVRSAILFFISILSTVRAQDTTILKQDWQQIAQTADAKVKAFLTRNLNEDLYLVLPHQKDEWLDKVLNTKSEWDTIRIESSVQPQPDTDEANNMFYSTDSCFLEAFDIDSLGIHGVIITRYVTGSEHCVGETFDFIRCEKQKITEIWNLERSYGNPEKLFSAKSYCSEKYTKRMRLIPPRPLVKKIGAKKNTSQVQLENNRYPDKEYFYNYNLKINANGNISITNTVTDKEKGLKPDHVEGIYIFKKGKYLFHD